MGLNVKWILIPFVIFALITLLYMTDTGFTKNMGNHYVEGLVTNNGRFTIDKGSEIPPRYYIVSSTDTTQTIAKIPEGYMLNPNKSPGAPAIIRILKPSVFAPNSVSVTDTPNDNIKVDPNNARYDPSAYNVEYHSSKEEEDTNFSPESGTWVYDSSKNKIWIPWSGENEDTTYYTPGSYPYGPGVYVPNYEDSIYMSETTQMSTVTPVYNTTDMLGGFCKQMANDPEKLEQTCNSMDLDKCASTSCCVLFGGTKCVTGNQNGPKTKANYSDIFVKNKDVYYYQGKCYGNC
jgi:hypothetical protein